MVKGILNFLKIVSNQSLQNLQKEEGLNNWLKTVLI
jgi:hypothetical protein